ncbi:hypothetical protein [uncultured Desulfosarcina sp.]|uniref:hypothetical protein n=1 Tax=uncultured Desulfosarcina sp. TaxID=218289 RepID=UPI0029C70078|nr:hypothetical protein [uncultured Desulfosarcina sp.]
MNKNNEGIWFPAMKYGIGWGLPVTWQGWIVFLIYIVLVTIGILFLKHSPWLIIPVVVYVFLLTGILLFICFKKGEKIELRWGKKL